MRKNLITFLTAVGFLNPSLTFADVNSEIVFASKDELQTASYVDVNRYLGKWYDIASIPQRFSKDCTNTTAEYALDKRGDLSVLNKCIVDGELSVARGTAKIKDKLTNAKLEVQFFWPFKGKYWIMEIGDNYEYALVGHPDRTYFWFLSRTPDISDAFYNNVMLRVQQKYGYRLNKIQRVIHDK
jgi:apolipoprotein D and lipocalin family protein